MNDTFDFNDLFVLDLANNHQGNIEHALNVIHGVGEVVRQRGVRAGLKFQFRQIDTMVHPDHQEQSDNKHIPRFVSTRLQREQYEVLLKAVRDKGMLAICTPFDDESVPLIVDMGFDILKIGSCSAQDWPLLEAAAESGLPVIFSTGGLTIKEIDDLVSFFEHRGVDFAIMHCVSIYPTPLENCQLNQIDLLRNRYHDKVIGWSTHESPDETVPIQIAVAKGARMFERHVGLCTAEIQLNAYSSEPAQVDQWIAAYQQAKSICGETTRPSVSESEKAALKTLYRGIYVCKKIKAGSVLQRGDVYFAMPYQSGQLASGEWQEGMTVLNDISVNEPIRYENTRIPSNPDVQVLKTAIHEIKAMLNEAKIALNSEFVVEYSHHYGMRNFRETGAVIINCINREYCKKLIVQLPGQNHPFHFHRKKEETFQILHGVLHVQIGDVEKTLQPGETCLVQAGAWHRFWTDTGCIFEEVSTTHFNNDSFYKDKKINKMERSERKTIVDHWGRFQLQDTSTENNIEHIVEIESELDIEEVSA